MPTGGAQKEGNISDAQGTMGAERLRAATLLCRARLACSLLRHGPSGFECYNEPTRQNLDWTMFVGGILVMFLVCVVQFLCLELAIWQCESGDLVPQARLL